MKNQIIRTPISRFDPPYRETVDETCDLATPKNSHRDDLHCIEEPVYYLPGPDSPGGREITRQRTYICSPCLREKLLAHYRTCPDACLGDPPFEAYAAERCSACGLFKCLCE